ncbi:hypothetical protein MUN82_16290 [Hymenobacter aerilatus]|uniref:DUF3108 domain-containing protein n=1 Tax=Hymenobacter aerilatus TaxID=2932251 RepID=A0A8T9SUU1_9BACT|nr:hypothetical protein [Hymenobacter aerilatus]UOR04493.1 hypothetical protein MUN82_16290 [Hymenobacter aerilatus]
MRIPLLFCLLLSVACHTTDPPITDTQTTGWQPILTENRRFVYAARWYAPGATTATLDTVVLTALGKPLPEYTPQMAYDWTFRHLDTTTTSTQKERVGAFDRSDKFWLHPPRRAQYRILELNPFPDIELPAKPDKTWLWTVFPPDIYADSAWVVWKGVLTVNHRYQVIDSTQLSTPLGRLPCYHVQAIGTCKLGTTALESYFNPTYGFVRLNYRNIDSSRLELQMVSVTSRPVLDKAMFLGSSL